MKISLTSIINAIRLKVQGSEPPTPASGYIVIYAEGSSFKMKDSSATITTFGAASGGGDSWLVSQIFS